MAEFNAQITGSLVALVTPMLTDGSIDFDRLRSLVKWHIAQSTDGLVVMGTTGESSLVSQHELLDVVKLVVETAKGQVPVIAGCGGTSTLQCVDLAKKLNQYELDALLCVTPYYVKPEQAGLISHFKEIALTSDAPIILYNVPGRTGTDLSNASVLALSKDKNIIGIKDATAELDRLVELKKHTGETFGFWSGDDETALEYLKLGGDGVISVTANVLPKQMSQWIEFAKQAKWNEATELFTQLMPLHRSMFIEANPIPVKWALKRMNKIESGYRKPLGEPADSAKALIEKALQASRII